MFSVNQHWDPLRVCLVGKSYNPEFYSFIKNSKVRNIFERIASETEEDYQKLIKLLDSFNVKILRPTVSDNFEEYLFEGRIAPPPMTPRDYSAMIGDHFYFDMFAKGSWDTFKGVDWPDTAPDNIADLPKFIQDELKSFGVQKITKDWDAVLSQIPNKILYDKNVNAAMSTRIGKDLYFGTTQGTTITDCAKAKQYYQSLFPDYRCHIIDTQGHSDGTFCPVKPGLIISLYDIPTYKDTFPDWDVIYLPKQSWKAIPGFLQLKEKNRGKWWVPGEELNDEFTKFVESWVTHWVGYVEETVFDVNMLVIDENNVICNNYNEKVFKAFERHNITPHILNFRHRYFWDGGLHCITSDLHREGSIKDYFPERT